MAEGEGWEEGSATALSSFPAYRCLLFIAPGGEGPEGELGIVEADVACQLPAHERGLAIGLVGTFELHFRHYQPLVVAMELVDLPSVGSTVNQLACLIDDTGQAEFHQVAGVVSRYLLLPFISAHPLRVGRTFNGKIASAASDTYPDRPAPGGADVALHKMVGSPGRIAIPTAHH